jgi:phytoene dehydrogenase-like protein
LFKSKKLQCVFISILADFFTEPTKFMGLGVFGLNPEPSFDARMPSSISKWGKQLYFYSLINGISTMADALGEVIQANGGNIHLNTLVDRIVLHEGVATELNFNGERESFDLIIANGGARETFYELVGKDNLPETLKSHLELLSLMHGVFMVHLGVDFDPTVYTKSVCTYYYGTYEFEEGIANAKSGHYHEGKEGFVVHVPTLHTPSMAPDGKHAMTIYTICPDTLIEGSWSDKKEEFADKLIAFAEKQIPGLKSHILTRVILTPEDFKARLHVNHFAFGGLAPEIGMKGISFNTPIKNLYYVGAQSETGGGVNRLGIETANNIKKLIKSWHK